MYTMLHTEFIYKTCNTTNYLLLASLIAQQFRSVGLVARSLVDLLTIDACASSIA